MLRDLISGIEQKKARLDRLRPLSTAALAQLQKHYDVELTYSSNADSRAPAICGDAAARTILRGVQTGGRR